jgi:hypothetical protein
MILHTTEVTPLPGYRLLLRFNNGVAGKSIYPTSLTAKYSSRCATRRCSLQQVSIRKCAQWHGRTVRTLPLNSCSN